MAEVALVVGIIAGLFVILFGSRGLLDLGKGIVDRRRERSRASFERSQLPEGVTLPPAGTPSLQAAPASIYRRPFVGRQAELTVLQAAFDRAASGKGCAVLVEGAAGIGKTAVCEQLAAYVSTRRGAVEWMSADAFTGSGGFPSRPTLLVMEDLSSPVDASLLAEKVGSAPILAVVTVDSPSAAGPIRRVAAEHVRLRGFSLDEVRRYLRELTGTDLPDALAEGVHRESQGNPLFVSELVRYLAEKGNLRLAGDRWEWDGHLPEEVVASDAPIAIVRQRLASLTEETKQILRQAARTGTEWDVRHVKGRKKHIAEAVDEALARHVIERDGDGYRFAHRLLREALLN